MGKYMNKFLKSLVAGLTLASMLTALPACGGGGGDPEVNMNIDLNNKIKLNLLMPSYGTVSDDPVNNDPAALAVQALTGYEVKYTQLSASDASGSLSTQMQSKESYHAVKLTTAQFADMIRDDMLLPLDDVNDTETEYVLDKFGPEIKRAIKDESWDVVTVDGKIYGIPERASSDNIENPLIFRQDWLDEMQMGAPTNLVELKEVLQAMKTRYEIAPLAIDMYTPLVYPISAAFGIYTDWQEYTLDGGAKKVLHFMEAPRYDEYVNYMADLYKEGLINIDMDKDTAADVQQKFYSSKAGVVATSIWSVSNLVEGFASNLREAGSESIANTRKPASINKTVTQEDLMCYVRSLADDGKVYRTSGYSYVTAIPYYMAENAGYVIDWINAKLTDGVEADATHNFRTLVLGNEDEHWTYSQSSGYKPLEPAFTNDKNKADYFLTGTNEYVYTEYWKARVRKNVELYRCWSELMEDADTYGVRNVTDAIPPLDDYSSNRSLETEAQSFFTIMVKTDKGTSKLNQYLTTYRNFGVKDATDAINEWYYGD